MPRSFLPASRLREIVRHARHELPRAFRPDDKSGDDPRCVGSRVVQAAVELGHGDLFSDLGGPSFDRFPQRGRLAGALGRVFPALDMNRSLGGVAGDIIGGNDSGDFESAWSARLKFTSAPLLVKLVIRLLAKNVKRWGSIRYLKAGEKGPCMESASLLPLDG